MVDTEADREVSPGQCGEFHVPERFREVEGWSLQPHDYILNNIGDFWGGHRAIEGFVPWEGTRYDTPIEDVALVAIERRGEVVWKLQRQHFLGKSYDVNNHPRTLHADKYESGFEDALEMAREWMQANPAHIANSLFLPDDPNTDDPAERFHVLTPGDDVETDYGYRNQNEVIAIVTDTATELPQGERLEEFVEPDEVEVGDRFVRTHVDGALNSYAFKHFSPYGFITGEGTEAPIAPRLTVSSTTGNAAVSFPEADAAFLVAPLDEHIEN